MGLKTIEFTPKARLIQILGEHLIKDATVGLIELVKNSYDADATSVEIIIESLNSKESKIIIKDNGSGMDEETFVNMWMNPASGHKEIQKENKKRTKLGRLPLGEKGVGRFAVQQIGNRLKMYSKMKNDEEELEVEINWRDFDDHSKNLSQISIPYQLKKNEHFDKSKCGTILEISELKSAWSDDDIRRTATSLKRMKSPFKGANDFDVSLKFINCPEEYTKYENLEPSDILEKAHYKFYGLIDEKSNIDFEYSFNMPGFKSKTKEGKLNLMQDFGINAGQELKCGGFFVNFFVYDRKPKSLKSNAISKIDLNEMCGVSVFRDGIRILPYGEKGNDWLNLDNRRIQTPGETIGNDQIIGLVEINQVENNELKDKTNREGLIENYAYRQFEKLLIGVVSVLEKEMRDDRKIVNPEKKKSEESVSGTISDVKNKLDYLTKFIKAEKPEDSANLMSEMKSVISKVDEIKKLANEEVENYEQVNKMLFNLAGTGLAAERFTHEFARLVSGASSSLDRLEKLLVITPRMKKEIEAIRMALEALKNDIKLLGPLFYVKKVAREKELDLLQIIKNTLLLQQHALEKENITLELEGDSFVVKMREGSCMQIFNNLIDNSIYWLSKKSEIDKKKIKIIMDPKTKVTYISDSGPGIVNRYKEKLFEPFFSLKAEEGRGLGLYIIKEILEEKNWNIQIVEKDEYPGLLNGANFKIIFVDKYE
ncbi:MAG: hypothetical protein CVV24_06605 [Ignavibacteriae bacterium HGW-Ignavibacteriae-3]|nr:MAG: hypothetical protein CVV24_06605 [Ignavibacteriae bacterium HGW-Ignavibacteriae-3]